MPSDTMKVQLRMWSVMTRMEISVFSFWPVGLAGDVLHMVQHALDGVHLEQVAHPLHHAGQALEAHAGVDVGRGRRS